MKLEKNKKRRILLCLVLAAIVFMFAACGGTDVNVNFVSGGEEIVESVTVRTGQKIGAPKVEREGYYVAGWYEDENLVGGKVNFPYKATKDVTLYAEWAPNIYTLTYNASGGNTEQQSALAVYGESFELEIPTRSGYTFGGWWSDAECLGTQYTAANGKGLFDWTHLQGATVFAKWTVNKYTVTYNAQGGTVNKQANDIIYGDDFVLEIPSLSGYTFGGWWSDAECRGTQYTDANGKGLFDWDVAKDLTLYADWTPNKYTVTYNAQGGKISFSTAQVTYGSGFELDVPTKNEFSFSGWWGDAECRDTQYTDANGKSLRDWNSVKDITLFAKWEYMKMPVMRITLAGGVQLGSVNRIDYIDSTVSVDSDVSSHALAASACQFRGRGNGSWNEPKKGYRLKFNSKQPLFGNVPSKHWALIASSTDTSFIRGNSAFNISKNVLTNIEYTTGYTNIELYVNGEYQGVYHVYDQVRVDKGRVDIKSEFGVEDTGYLIEYDSYYAQNYAKEGINYFRALDGSKLRYPFTVKSPDPDDYLEETTEAKFRAQVTYIKNYVSKVYSAALNRDFNTFAQYADVDSFVDMYILHELYKNTDTGWSSFFLYKKPGGLLYAGPPWDFDYTAGRSRGDSTTSGIYVADTCATHSDYTSSELYINLYKTSGFLNAVKKRWQEITSDVKWVINTMITNEYIAYYRPYYGKNYTKWRNESQSAGEARWEGQVNLVKNWLLNRITWLNTEWA